MTAMVSGVPADALQDLRQAASSWRLWHSLAWTDVKRQVHLAKLGVLWLPMMTGIHVTVLTFIFSHINQVEAASFALYVACGFIIWNFMSETLIDGTRLFQQASATLQNSIQPRSLFVFRLAQRQSIRMGFNLLLLPVIFLIFRESPSSSLPLAVIGLVPILLAAPGVALLAGLIGLRFPDIRLATVSVVRISLFATPIFWLPERLGAYADLIVYNPFYHFINVVRQPILGEPVDPLSWAVVLGLTLFLWLSAVWLYRMWFKRAIFWL